jgi:thymidylate synthase (FAD)
VKIIEPSFKLSTPFGPLTPEGGIQMLRFIEAQARISHRSEEAQTENSWKRFIQAVVIGHGDWSVTEHVSITATIRVDRGVTHELVRHRLFSFTQESTRFVRYGGELEFICPVNVVYTGTFSDGPHELFSESLKQSEEAYFQMLKKGSRPQEARSVLPNALAATIAVTGNLRNFRHLFLMRTSRETHPDFRRIMDPMLAEFKRLIPLLYEDIEPNARQIDNLKKAR